MTSFLALRASVCIFLWCLFNYFARFGLDGTATWMEQLPGLDTAARMEQLPGWNNYLGSNLRPQTTRALTLPIELRGASTYSFKSVTSLRRGPPLPSKPEYKARLLRASPRRCADGLRIIEAQVTSPHTHTRGTHRSHPRGCRLPYTKHYSHDTRDTQTNNLSLTRGSGGAAAAAAAARAGGRVRTGRSSDRLGGRCSVCHEHAVCAARARSGAGKRGGVRSATVGVGGRPSCGEEGGRQVRVVRVALHRSASRAETVRVGQRGPVRPARFVARYGSRPNKFGRSGDAFAKSSHWKGGYWGGQIHTSRDYLCFRKRSRGPPLRRTSATG